MAPKRAPSGRQLRGSGPTRIPEEVARLTRLYLQGALEI